MTAPTRAQLETAMGGAIKMIDQAYRFGSKNANNFLGLIETVEASPGIAGDFADEMLGAAQSMRALMAGTVSRAVAQNILRPFIKAYCRYVIGRTDLTTDQAMLAEWYKYYIDNRLRVSSRVFTFGTPTAAAGNIGTTQILRLTKDRYNFDIETAHIDAKRARCVLDSNTGTSKGNESWFLEGQVPPKDDLLRSGSGLSTFLTGLTPDDSLLSNPDFRNFTATSTVSGGLTTTPTDITDWTSSVAVSGSVYNLDNTPANIYRVAPSNSLSNAYSLAVLATTVLTQKFSLKGTKLDLNVPYMFVVIWNRVIGGASGTLVLRNGNTQQSIAVAAQTGWNVSAVPTSPSWASWYRVFAEDDLQVDIDWTKTGGTLYIAEAMYVPGVYFDGHWHWVLPSSASAYIAPRVNDQFDWPDLATDTSGINQRTLAFAWPGFYLPSANGSGITWSDS